MLLRTSHVGAHWFFLMKMPMAKKKEIREGDRETFQRKDGLGRADGMSREEWKCLLSAEPRAREPENMMSQINIYLCQGGKERRRTK